MVLKPDNFSCMNLPQGTKFFISQEGVFINSFLVSPGKRNVVSSEVRCF